MIRDVVKVGTRRPWLETDARDDRNCLRRSVPDGKRIAAGDPSKKRVMLWNARTGALERTLRTGRLSLVRRFFAGQQGLVVGGQKGITRSGDPLEVKTGS